MNRRIVKQHFLKMLESKEMVEAIENAIAPIIAKAMPINMYEESEMAEAALSAIKAKLGVV